MPYTIAGIDIHKNVLMVVVTEVTVELQLESRRLGTTASERQHLVAWLQQRGVQEVVMESTAQYWKPVWLDLEPHFRRLHLAQAHSNRAPKGRKHDFADAERLIRRLVAGELSLSFVPDAEQRSWHTARTCVCAALTLDPVRWRGHGYEWFAKLRNRGVGTDLAATTAGSPHGPWRLADSPALHLALPNAYFDSLGIPRLTVYGKLNPPNRRMRTRMSGGVAGRNG